MSGELAQWLTEGQNLAKDAGGYQWRIADWLLSGEARFRGDIYDMAEKATGYKRKTLQEWAYVARHSSMRMEDLTFNHHQVVAALLPEAQKLCLTRASDEKLSVSELRELAKWQPRRLEYGGEYDTNASLLLRFENRRELELLEISARQRGHISDDKDSGVGRLIREVIGEYLRANADLEKETKAEHGAAVEAFLEAVTD